MARKSLRGLNRYDKRTGLSRRTRDIARARGHPTKIPYEEFGRTLPTYHTIYENLRQFGRALKGKTLLHLASSTGIFTKFLQDKGMMAIPFDIHPDAMQIAKRLGNRTPVRGDALQLPFKDNSFDFVVSDMFILSNYIPFERFQYFEGPEAARRYDKAGKVFQEAIHAVKIGKTPAIDFFPWASLDALEEVKRTLKPSGIALLTSLEGSFKPPVKEALEKLLKWKGFSILKFKAGIIVVQKK